MDGMSVPPNSYAEPNPHCDGLEGGPLGVTGWSAHEWGQCPYQRDPRQTSPLALCEDTAAG